MMATWEDFWDNYTGRENNVSPPEDPYPGAPDPDLDDITDDVARDHRRDRNKKPGKNASARDQLRWVLEGYGLRPAQFADIIDKAIRNGWSPQQFESAVYRSRPFRQAFPGIFRPDGSLRMSPQQYLQQADAYRELAQRYGLKGNLDDKRIGKLIEGNVSMTELNDRFTALYRMEEYRPYMDAFKEVLASRGITRNFNDAEMFRFIMGQAPKQFYEVWEQASVGASAARAGVDLNAKQMRSIAQAIPGVQDESQLYGNFQSLAQKIQTLLPLSKMAKFGITRKDLIELEFGGENQAAIGQRVEELINVLQGEQDDSRRAQSTNILQTSQQRLHGATS